MAVGAKRSNRPTEFKMNKEFEMGKCSGTKKIID